MSQIPFHLNLYIDRKPRDAKVLDAIFNFFKMNETDYLISDVIAKFLDEKKSFSICPGYQDSDLAWREFVIKFFPARDDEIESDNVRDIDYGFRYLKEWGGFNNSLTSVEVYWYHAGDGEVNTELYSMTTKAASILYETLHPVFGFTYWMEIQRSRYHLVPTADNILKHGPRDLTEINIYSPKIAQKIGLTKLREKTNLNITEFSDGGVMINLKPEFFLSSANYEEDLSLGEKLLNWQ